MQRVAAALLAIGIVAAAAALRLPDLAERPMHTDEAVNAVILDTLRSQADYVYDPIEHHGPSLPYFALSMLRVGGVDSFAAMSETQLRLVTALFGIALVGLLFLLGPLVGSVGRLSAMSLAALSPAAVYYSRYYIHEMLLVVFSLLAIVGLWRGVQSRHPATRAAWWIASGLGLGFMHATKETCVISYAAMAVGVMAAWRGAALPGASARGDTRNGAGTPLSKRGWLLFTIVPAVLASVACFSFFGTDARGPLDSVLTFDTYLRRAGGADTLHVQPWWYYFTLLGYTKLGPFVWSEVAVFIFGVVGLFAVWRGAVRSQLLSYESLPTTVDPRFARFIAAYALTMTAVYVAIPYKTPWCILEFWLPWMVLAGLGVGSLLSPSGWGRRRPLAIVATLIFVASIAHLGRQAYLAAFPLSGSYRNPYVYAHPLGGVVQLSDYVCKLVTLDPSPVKTPVLVYSDHPWPLPWYLRSLDRVGYWDRAEGATDVLQSVGPAIIIAAESEADAIRDALPTEYAVNTYGLRPGVRLVLFVHPELRARFVKDARRP